MKFTYNVGDKLVAKKIKTVAKIINTQNIAFAPLSSVLPSMVFLKSEGE